MAKPPERPKGVSAEDEALFRQAMRQARPLGERPARVSPVLPPAVPKPRPKPPEPAAPPHAMPAPPALPPQSPPPLSPQFVVERRAVVPGLDRRTAARLSRGQLVIEARLDLHGLRQEAAHAALRAFVLDSARTGRRCVLVVTGKGLAERNRPAPPMGEEPPGVLKRNLPRWLNQPPLADKVLALRPATQRDGGEGAFYLLLRRQRG